MRLNVDDWYNGLPANGLAIKFSRYVNWRTAFDRDGADNSRMDPWRVLAMPESAKPPITGDGMIIVVGFAILIVLALVGAL